MKFKINSIYGLYFIDFDCENNGAGACDDAIADVLNLDVHKYKEKGQEYNGYIEESNELFFKDRNDAEKFLEYLTPYTLISILAEDEYI
ncbi:MAG: hypothetical protein ACOCP8_01880 [archaeon]